MLCPIAHFHWDNEHGWSLGHRMKEHFSLNCHLSRHSHYHCHRIEHTTQCHQQQSHCTVTYHNCIWETQEFQEQYLTCLPGMLTWTSLLCDWGRASRDTKQWLQPGEFAVELCQVRWVGCMVESVRVDEGNVTDKLLGRFIRAGVWSLAWCSVVAKKRSSFLRSWRRSRSNIDIAGMLARNSGGCCWLGQLHL